MAEEQQRENTLEEKLLAEATALGIDVPEVDDVPWPSQLTIELAEAVFAAEESSE